MSDQPPPGSYPAMPPEPSRGPAAQGVLPGPVANAVKLMYARAAVSLLSLPVLFTSRDSLRAQLSEADATITPAELDSGVSVAITVGVGFAVVFSAVYVLLALQVRKGKSWARTVTWVLAGLSVLFGVASLLSPAPGLARVVGLVALALDVAIIVLLAAKASSGYFRHQH